MGHKRKAIKAGYELIDQPIEETRSSSSKNTSNEVGRAPSSLRATEFSATSKDVFHISDDFEIEIVRDTHSVAADDEDDELDGVDVVPPLSILNVPKIKSLLEWLDKPKNATAEEAADQARPKNEEGAQADEEAVPITSSYNSLDSTDDEALRLSRLKRKGVKELN